jgi:hypothetical protein
MNRISPSLMSPESFSKTDVKFLDIVVAYNFPKSPWEQMAMLN